MEEFLENLLYSALFPQMDQWRRSRGAEPPAPPDEVCRVFMRMELRLQQRYGYGQLQEMVAMVRINTVRRRLLNMQSRDAWDLLQRTALPPAATYHIN